MWREQAIKGREQNSKIRAEAREKSIKNVGSIVTMGGQNGDKVFYKKAVTKRIVDIFQPLSES